MRQRKKSKTSSSGCARRGSSSKTSRPNDWFPDDPKDDYLVALTHASGADYLVSGDPHLAGAENKVSGTVLTPRQFSELMESEHP